MDVRVEQPNILLCASGVRIFTHKNTIYAPNGLPDNQPKILVHQRMVVKDGVWLETMKTLLARNWLVVAEIDDYPADTGLKKNNSKWANSMGWQGYSCCHAAQTSTEALANELLKYNPEVGVFENQLFQLPEFVWRTDENVRVFYGALNRQEDWKSLMPSLNQVAKKHNRIQFIVVHDEEFFQALETENKVFYGTAEYAKYLKLMSACDVMLLPLKDTKFKRCKSDIKFVEAAAAGLAVIASPTVYAGTIEDGRTGMIARSIKDWPAMLEQLVLDNSLRKKLGQAAQEYVCENRLLSQHINSRIDWYYSLWERRDELTDGLIQRFPELQP